MTAQTALSPLGAGLPLVNLRDLGGLTTRDGSRVRPGLLFRSAAPFDLTAADGAAIADALGLGLVVDLRHAGERAAVPWPVLPSAVEMRAVELATLSAGGGGSGAGASETAAPMWPTPFGPREFGLWYATIASQGAGHLADLVRVFADPAAVPALVHCTAGKDRTGIVAACVLSLLDADEDTIVADYTRTQLALDAIRAHTTAVLPGLAGRAVPAVILSAEEETIRTFLAEVTTAHAGFAALLAPHGVGEAEIEALRSRFLDR
ncbi:tyrosine-protein phosphatase [Yinghuangia sp. YIM S09857]|uniref:tyrosine-protein phosphatase n=1 Tax=Yinghuangia sp. YIM S09857 TaxID=3436929 RepID=UPI003F534888